MKSNRMSRREFLKLGAASLGGLALQAYTQLPPGTVITGSNASLARIAVGSVSVYSQPWDESRILYQRYRDEIVHLYYQVISDKGPAWNPIWFRVWGGYIHSQRLQYVGYRYNDVAPSIRQGGQLAEVTVPVVHPMINRGNGTWEPNYPLYFQSVHWVAGVEEGPDGLPWYKLKEPWDGRMYDAPASALRLIADEELTPLSPDVSAEDKRIEVSLTHQTLTAFEGDRVVLQTKISSGLNRAVPDGTIPWNTPAGSFRINSKMPTQHMGNGNITSNVSDYELLGVPWDCYFHENGNATHGTYWHNNFGVPMSHGCVNMRMENALWIFRWSTPVWTPGTREQKGRGTRLIVSG
jgi:lipoprotein-anchoring transpeptidase ErfK/SrfK